MPAWMRAVMVAKRVAVRRTLLQSRRMRGAIRPLVRDAAIARHSPPMMRVKRSATAVGGERSRTKHEHSSTGGFNHKL